MSDHTHLTLDLIAEIDAGRAPVELIAGAISERCSLCLSTLIAYLDRDSPAAGSYRNLWRRAEKRFSTLAETVRDEISESHRTFGEYVRLSLADRQRFAASDSRCTSRAFIDRLLDAARASLPGDPENALVCATHALTALDRRDHSALDQHIIALAHQANAQRALGRFHAASLSFARARTLAAQEVDTDADTLAELDFLEASLLIDLRRFEAAEALLARALETYQELGQVTLTAQTLIKLGHLFSTANAPEAAIRPYRMALEIISEDTDPQLYLAARLNLTHALFELGRFIEARDLLAYDEDIYERHADQHIAIRRIWLEGRIYRATGETDRAETLLLRTRDVFTAQQHGFNAALVSLDLALLYHQLGRFDDLTETVATAVKLFSAYSLHSEALAALVTLHHAAYQRAVSAESIERVATFLREIAADPGPRSQAPS